MAACIGIWVDVGCADLERAAFNRQMVKEKTCVIGYLEAENGRKTTPFSKFLAHHYGSKSGRRRSVVEAVEERLDRPRVGRDILEVGEVLE